MENVEIVREKLKTELPLLQQMAVDIVEYQPGHVIVEAPLGRRVLFRRPHLFRSAVFPMRSASACNSFLLDHPTQQPLFQRQGNLPTHPM